MIESLFVYGSLRRGERAEALLAGGACLGAARTRGRLYDLGAYPGLVASDEEADVVHGELWSVPEALLPRLDRYEGDAYRRERTSVLPESGPAVEAWLYLYLRPVAARLRVASGRYPTRATRAGSAGPRG